MSEEVFIYAAWKMYKYGIPKKKASKKQRMGLSSPDGKSFQIISFLKSSPNPKQKNNKYGWNYKKESKVLRKQIKQIGERYYEGTGRCLN